MEYGKLIKKYGKFNTYFKYNSADENLLNKKVETAGRVDQLQNAIVKGVFGLKRRLLPTLMEGQPPAKAAKASEEKVTRSGMEVDLYNSSTASGSSNGYSPLVIPHYIKGENRFESKWFAHSYMVFGCSTNIDDDGWGHWYNPFTRISEHDSTTGQPILCVYNNNATDGPNDWSNEQNNIGILFSDCRERGFALNTLNWIKNTGAAGSLSNMAGWFEQMRVNSISMVIGKYCPFHTDGTQLTVGNVSTPMLNLQLAQRVDANTHSDFTYGKHFLEWSYAQQNSAARMALKRLKGYQSIPVGLQEVEIPLKLAMSTMMRTQIAVDDAETVELVKSDYATPWFDTADVDKIRTQNIITMMTAMNNTVSQDLGNRDNPSTTGAASGTNSPIKCVTLPVWFEMSTTHRWCPPSHIG